MKLDPEHRLERLLERLAENPDLVRNRHLDQNLDLDHRRSPDLLLIHALNHDHHLGHVVNQGQDRVHHSQETLLNRGPDQNQSLDLVLELQRNLDLELHRVQNLDRSQDLGQGQDRDRDPDPDLDLDPDPNPDPDPDPDRDRDRDRDRVVVVAVGLVAAVVKVVPKVNKY